MDSLPDAAVYGRDRLIQAVARFISYDRVELADWNVMSLKDTIDLASLSQADKDMAIRQAIETIDMEMAGFLGSTRVWRRIVYNTFCEAGNDADKPFWQAAADAYAKKHPDVTREKEIPRHPILNLLRRGAHSPTHRAEPSGDKGRQV